MIIQFSKRRNFFFLHSLFKKAIQHFQLITILCIWLKQVKVDKINILIHKLVLKFLNTFFLYLVWLDSRVGTLSMHIYYILKKKYKYNLKQKQSANKFSTTYKQNMQFFFSKLWIHFMPTYIFMLEVKFHIYRIAFRMNIYLYACVYKYESSKTWNWAFFHSGRKKKYKIIIIRKNLHK